MRLFIKRTTDQELSHREEEWRCNENIEIQATPDWKASHTRFRMKHDHQVNAYNHYQTKTWYSCMRQDHEGDLHLRMSTNFMTLNQTLKLKTGRGIWPCTTSSSQLTEGVQSESMKQDIVWQETTNQLANMRWTSYHQLRHILSQYETNHHLKKTMRYFIAMISESNKTTQELNPI